MGTEILPFAVLSLLAAGIITCFIRRKPLTPSLPPGPQGLPILGNILDISTTEPWLSFKRLGEKYGDLVHIRLLAQDMIILNSYEAIRDLLEQRSYNYSNRPHRPKMEIIGTNWNTIFLTYGNEWRLHRIIFRQALRSETMHSYYPVLSMKTRELLRNISDRPAGFKKHLGRYATAVGMATTYDYHLAVQSDPMVEKIEEFDDTLRTILSPTFTMTLMVFPLLTYIPVRFLGASWKPTEQQARRLMDWWFTTPIQYVKDKMAAGSVTPCIIGDALSRLDGKQVDAASMMRIAKGVGATSLFAAPDSTNSTLQVFLLAMVLYPDVQKRAQDEILAVVGTGRLSDFDDRPNLPYIDAIMRETLRWHPVAPYGKVLVLSWRELLTSGEL